MKARHRPRSRLWFHVFERLYGPFAEVIVRETVKRGTESVDKVRGQVCQGPLTHAYLYLLACSLARNGLTNDELDMSGLLRLVEVLPLTKIESLECAPASSERLYVSAH